MSAAGRCVAAAVAAVCALAGVVLGATGASAAELSDAGARAFADVAACAATADHLLAAIVVDESGSLRQTDPDDRRVPAITTAVDALEQLGTSSGGRLDVQASLATFGRTSASLVDWGTVTGAHAAALHSAATTQLPGRDRADLTDYRAALRGAQATLAERAAAVGGTSCKVVLWFTDGRLDVDGTGDGPATEQARAELCAPQGVVDGLRADGVAVVALALFTAEGKGSVTPQDRERLRAIAEGAGEGEACGSVPVPASAAGGAFLRADDATAVRRLFAQAAALIEGGSAGVSTTCPDTTCVDGRLTIPVDAGVGGFRLAVEHAADAPAGRLVGPGGTAATDAPTQDLEGASVTTSTRDGFTVLDVRTDPARPGTWTFVADPARSVVVDLYWFWGMSLDVEAPDGVVLGETSEVRVVPRLADGRPADLDVLGDVTLEVTVDGVPHVAARDGDGWTLQLDVPTADARTAVDVAVVARATSAPHAVALGPVATQARLATRFPPSFPTPGALELGRMVGDGAATGTLVLTGADRGDTRACVGGADVSGPEAAGAITVTAAPDCVDVPAGGTAELVVTVSAQHAADGHVDGTLPVRLEGVDGDAIDASVAFSTSMVRPVDEGRRWGLVLAFLAGALVLAWATLEVSRRVADRFVLTTDARSAAVPVLVDASGVRRADGHDGPLLDPATDFRPMGIARRSRLRSVETQGIEMHRRYPLLPLRAGTAWVSASSGAVVVSDVLGSAPADGSRAPVRFPGTTGWVLVTEPPQDGPLRARLVVVVDSPRGVAHVLPDRLDQLRHGTSWDLVSDRVRSAWQVRADAEARATQRAAGGRPKRGPTATGPTTAPDPVAPAPGVPTRRPVTYLEDAPTSAGRPKPASWSDESAGSSPSAPSGPSAPATAPRRPSAAPPDASAPGTPPTDVRPPSVNYWD